MVAGYMAGPPFGAWLFAAAAALPFGFDAASFLAAALLVGMLPRPAASVLVAERRLGRVRTDVAEGVRWLWRHPVLRMLAVSIGLMNLTFGGTMAIFVLYARERLGIGTIPYGVLLGASAAGGVLGSGVVGRLHARFGPAPLLRLGLSVEAATHLVLALTRRPWVAGVTLTVFGVHAVMWTVVTVSLRQRVVPERLLGRVNSVYYLFSTGGVALGALLAGLVARAVGITAPFWIGFGSMALLALVGFGLFTPEALASSPPEQGEGLRRLSPTA
jgi:Na+/melibiose symporter-like transporter